MRKLIGVTSEYRHYTNKKSLEVNNTYIRAVERAGGFPIIIPILEDKENIDIYLDLIDGLVLTGGADILPSLFGEDPMKETTSICLDRDMMELKLVEKAIERNIPILGVCRGLQVINVALGGNLYQDIPKQVAGAHGHVSIESVFTGYHDIKIEKDSFLYEIFNKDKLLVNSLHHQAVKDLGEGLKVSAKSNDGIIEAIEGLDKPIYCVQFHPEALAEKKEEFLNIFKFFINNL